MRALLIIASMWPGLPQAWLWGRLSGLALACAFACSLNFALVTTLVWPQWPAGWQPGFAATAAWVLVLGLWIVGLAGLRHDWSRLFPRQVGNLDEQDEWFREAQILYLKGHWIEAESLAARILAHQPADIETRLLLASIQRRSRQHDRARDTLLDLHQHPAASQWHYEINVELEQLSKLELPAEAMAAATRTSLPQAA